MPDSTIATSEINYINSMSLTANPHRQLTDSEAAILQKALGQLKWVAGMSRSEISFKVTQARTRIENATINYLFSPNKVLKYIKKLHQVKSNIPR